MVHVAIVPVIADDPQSVFVELLIDTTAIFLRFFHNRIIPFRHIVNGVDDLLNMLWTETVLRDVGTIVLLFIARVAHNPECIFCAVVLNGLESDIHILPTAVKVLASQRQSVVEFIAFVLVIDLVVFVFLRQSEEPKLEQSRAVFGLLNGGQSDAFQNGIVHIHIKGDRLITAKVRHWTEIIGFH